MAALCCINSGLSHSVPEQAELGNFQFRYWALCGPVDGTPWRQLLTDAVDKVGDEKSTALNLSFGLGPRAVY